MSTALTIGRKNHQTRGASMIRRTPVGALVVMAIGSMLGFGAAMGKVNLDQNARGEQTASSMIAGRSAASVERPTSSCAGVNKSELLALATHNQAVAAETQASGKRPNICIIWGDDIGQSNISAYSLGVMGY